MGADTSGRLLRRVNALVRFDMADSEIRSSSKYDNGAFRRGRELIYNFTHAMCEILVFFFFLESGRSLRSDPYLSLAWWDDHAKNVRSTGMSSIRSVSDREL
jgi:hypothetical protein